MSRPDDPRDEKTRLIDGNVRPKDPRDQETTILPGRGGGNWGTNTPPGQGGLGMPDRPRAGTMMGQVDLQNQVRSPGGAPPQGYDPRGPARPSAPAPGETVFFVPGADPAAAPFDPVVGWLVVLKGPGRGLFRPVYYGQNSVGRGADQRVPLDFGDQRISRETHAFIIYDEIGRKFFLRDNGKSNVLRVKGHLVMEPTEILNRDEITIGDTTLMFVSLCNPEFDWLASHEPAKT